MNTSPSGISKSRGFPFDHPQDFGFDERGQRREADLTGGVLQGLVLFRRPLDNGFMLLHGVPRFVLLS